MYERFCEPPLSRLAFLRRLALHAGSVGALVLGSLGIGILGFLYFERSAPTEAFLNSALILGGLGLIGVPGSIGGKLFASFYGLYAGLVFLAAFGIMFAPIVHRLLHTFHWSGDHGQT